jgi:hypothetical protein
MTTGALIALFWGLVLMLGAMSGAAFVAGFKASL